MHLIRRLSLRQKLPLLVCSLTGGVLVVAGTLTYIEVRATSMAAASARLQAVAEQLSELSSTGLANRRLLEEEVGQSEAVQRALTRELLDTTAVTEALARLRTGVAADRDLPIHLFAADSSVVFTWGTAPGGDAPRHEAQLDTVPAYSPFRKVGDAVLYWNTTPVRDSADRLVGWIAQRRRVGSTSTKDQLELLIGSGVSIGLGQPGGTFVDLGGKPIPPPPADLEDLDPFTFSAAGGAEVLGAVANLPGTPWVVLVEMPMDLVLARPRLYLGRVVGVGLLLVLVVLFVSWKLSRRLTRPIGELAEAANALAGGEYGRRVPEDRGEDELAALASAFNAMAAQVERSEEALRRRLEEARALADSMEQATVLAEHAREEAQAANRTKSEFLATMSHEIRTPINAVIGYTELLTLGIPDAPTDRQRDYLERISRSSRLLMTLVNDVLDFSRIESGRLEVDVGEGSAEEVIATGFATLEPEAARKGQTMERACPENVTFRGDQQRVQQILLNLLSNAVKFTPAGGLIRVCCSRAPRGPEGDVSEDTDWLRIDVEDTGVGIPPEQMEHLFEPFVQGDQGFTREHGGAGLGLAISRRLAKLMAGEITVRSTPGEGSCFTLWLRGARTTRDERSVAVG